MQSPHALSLDELRSASISPSSLDEAGIFQTVWAAVRQPIRAIEVGSEDNDRRVLEESRILEYPNGFNGESVERSLTAEELAESHPRPGEVVVTTGWVHGPLHGRGRRVKLRKAPTGTWEIVDQSEWMA